MDDETCVAGSWGRISQTCAPYGRSRRGFRRLAAAPLCLALLGLAGCRSSGPVKPEQVPNNWFGHASIAVAPAVNLSGSRDFDPNRVADLMAVELGYVQGIRVIPVSRVLGVLAAQGLEEIASPAHAVEVAQWVGADAILVFAITEYDPYDPPRVGMTAQLFGAKGEPTAHRAVAHGEPTAGTAVAHDERQVAQGDQPVAHGEPTAHRAVAHGESESASQPAMKVPVLAETQRVFDASHAAVIGEVQEFAKRRVADDSPYGWRQYVATQQGFLEFCCHKTVTALAQKPVVTTAVVVQER